ncbi:alpha-amylase family glycosyl hydrolase [Arenicella xantha]|uniref:alpha-amylase family glycosyl hydrolase n=1 Tax=Arenicella xantha TaxID=644221 RepID=UPI003CCC483C
MKQHSINQDWWRGAVIYQVYPRSFCDTSGDGIGDIRGIINKLDYIVELGVDAVWVSPFFKSPMKDFGYDISDYRDVDPIFGSLSDFDELIDQAKQRNLKVMIDQVLSHTSDQHDWFVESSESRSNAKADWYVWADPKADGSAPNNWISIFGGSAWEWHAGRGQYYLHNFLKSQPDLNFHCAELRQQILQELEFWLKRGVDGFRLDAINFCYHDQSLRDNPFKPREQRTGRGFSPDNPYAAQYHHFDNTQIENLSFLESVRDLLNQYPGTVALGEINSEDSLKTLSEYTEGGKRLHMGYNFELLADEFSVDHIKTTVNSLEAVIGEGWPCWAVSNHDVTRVVTRWGNGKLNQEFAKMTLALAASLRGTLCVYQGEELGFTEAPIQRDQLKDPFGIEFWPEFKGRDGCRTPIAWDESEPNAGFSQGSAWLPVAPDHAQNNVSVQIDDPGSVLNFYKSFLSWRSEQTTLIKGDICFIDAPDNLLVIKRSHDQQTTIACFNLSDQPIIWQPQKLDQELVLGTYKFGEKTSLENNIVQFAPYGFAYFA